MSHQPTTLLQALTNAVRELEGAIIKREGVLPEDWPTSTEAAVLELLRKLGGGGQVMASLKRELEKEGEG